MKTSFLSFALIASLICLCAVGPARASHLNILAEPARAVDGGRVVNVLISQAEIKSNINASYVDVAMGGGLIGALIDMKIDSDRAKKAERVIQPLRTALAGFDVDALALETTKTALANVAWFLAPSITFGRDTTPAGKSADPGRRCDQSGRLCRILL